MFDVLGALDELNSNVGCVFLSFSYHSMAKELCLAEKEALSEAEREGKEGHDLLSLVEFLEWVQMRLLDTGSHCATPLSTSSAVLIERVKFPEDSLKTIERYVSQFVDFLLSGG